MNLLSQNRGVKRDDPGCRALPEALVNPLSQNRGVKRDDPGCRALPEALVNSLSDSALIKTIPLEHFPRDLFMIGRSLMILRGLTHSLGMDVKVGSSQ